ncbi:uncharacterized protein [Amphiura filiformis]|uniref:uncharacterized protein isoform X2 n=1 Tax=Amphiura filiformis TaxID=82378 RepID=UPI003B211B65
MAYKFVLCFGVLLVLCIQCFGQRPGGGGGGPGRDSGVTKSPGSGSGAENSTRPAGSGRGSNSSGGMSGGSGAGSESGSGGSSAVDFDGLPQELGSRCTPDDMRYEDMPCFSCGCFPSEEKGRGPQGRYKCELVGTSTMCAELRDIWFQIDAPCERDVDEIPLGPDDQCSCNCNPAKYEWKCEANEDATNISAVCNVVLNHKNIEAPPASDYDITVLYPQSCMADGDTYLMGDVMVRPGCEVCVCVDGCWYCERDDTYCDAAGNLIESAGSCSDRVAPFYPLGTYAQEGPHYSICLFGEWEEASFAATIRKQGECPVYDPVVDGDTTCEAADKTNQCLFDSRCGGDSKCCFDQCQIAECTGAAALTYSAECPSIPDGPGPCLNVCTPATVADDCAADQLCCSNGCGYECSNGVTYDPDTHMIVGQEDEDRIELRLCDLNGELKPTGYQDSTDPNDPCIVRVCVNGEWKSFDDANCVDGAQPTCSCTPEGLAPVDDIPFGTIWHVTRCEVCACFDGEWQCSLIDQCAPDMPEPAPCQLSDLVMVPTGHASENGCCICMNGEWTCESPDCEVPVEEPMDCTDSDGNTVRHGSYSLDGCTVSVCVDGTIRYSEICGGGGGGAGAGSGGGGSSGTPQLQDLCPRGTTRCPDVVFQKNDCFNNTDCPTNTICCTNGCVNNCIITPDGQPNDVACPAQMMQCSEQEIAASACNTDNECLEGEVCCRERRGCYGVCVKPPALPRAGLCPVMGPPDFGDVAPGDVIGECTEDADCADTSQKCCGGTVTQCVTPLDQPEASDCTDADGNAQSSGTVITGDPRPNGNCEVCVCADGEWICDQNVQCDSSGDPTLLPCDNPGAGQAMNGEALVLECLIRVCFNGQWLNRDLQACRRPDAIIKDGDCPRGESLQAADSCPDNPEATCGGDEDCDGTLKCCWDGCTVSCVARIEERPGECPSVTVDNVSPCLAGDVDACGIDSECSGGNNKCCFDGCRRTCQPPFIPPVPPTCVDPEGGTPYSQGQIRNTGEGTGICDICVCVGEGWVCTETPEAACNGSVPLTCFDPILGGVLRDIPSGTLQRDGCMQRLCLNGTWEYSIPDDCCPDLPNSCEVRENVIIASGMEDVNVDGDICRACICVNGILVCREFAAADCVGGRVTAPQMQICWIGGEAIPSGTVGLPTGNDGETCGCFWGRWKCSGFIDEMEPIVLKPGVCPSQFDLLGLFGIEPPSNFRGGKGNRGGNGNHPGNGPRGNGGGSSGGDSNEGGNGNNGGGNGGGNGNNGGGNGGGPGWDPSGIARPGSGSSQEDGGVMDQVRGKSGGQGGGQGGGRSGGQGGRPDTPGGRSKRQSGRGGDRDMEMQQDALDELEETTFDGCVQDFDCADRQICCGRDLGGACVDPFPEEENPLPCEYDDVYYRTGIVRPYTEVDDAGVDVCSTCICVHGDWICLDINCGTDPIDCPVGDASFGLSVPSGALQFLQCEICACLNGEFRCNERACPNDRSGSFCPAEIPRGINPNNPKYACGENSDCSNGDICCEYDNFGRVCVPAQLPNIKNGDCPTEDNERPCDSYKTCYSDANCKGSEKCCNPESIITRCEFDLPEGQGICTSPAGNPCPGNRPWTPCQYVNPCEAVGECESNSDLTCEATVCTSCRAAFYDRNGNARECDDLKGKRCNVPRGRDVEVGTAVYNPDNPCSQCMCGPDLQLECDDAPECGT